MYKCSEGDLIALVAASTKSTKEQEVRVHYWLGKKGLTLHRHQSGWFAADPLGSYFGPATLHQMEDWAKA